jgi:putative flippase GtrA
MLSWELMWAILLPLVLNVFNHLRQYVAEMFDRNRFLRSTDFNLSENRFMRFLVAGGVNTLFGFAVYSAFILAGMHVWLALLIGTLCGTVFNFITTGGYVFREMVIARFPRFFICYLLVYCINFLLIELISIWLTNKIYSQAILTFPMALLSYLMMKNFVFSPTLPPT